MQKTYGGDLYDNGFEMYMTDENAFVIGGTTQSGEGLGKGNHSVGTEDFVIFKVSANGRMMWRTVIGGMGREDFARMKPTLDGGYAIFGTTNSNDNDISGNSGKFDMVLVKVDGLGRLLWTRTYGGTGNDKGFALYPLNDGGFLIGGEIGSLNDIYHENRGGLDCFVARVNAKGDLVWYKILGGSKNEKVVDVIGFPNGRVLMVGTTTSRDRDVKNSLGKLDVWAVMLSKNQDIVWQKNFGGADFDDVQEVEINHRGNIILTGTTFSSNNHISKQNGLGDIWVFEIEPIDGNLIWSKTYGGAKSDAANSITPTADGGYLVSGSSTSENGFVSKCHGHYDGVIMKIDSLGEKKWVLMLGGEDYEAIYRTIALPTGDFMAVGYAESTDGDLTSTGKIEGNDVWFMKLSFTGGKEFKSKQYITGFTHDAISGESVQAEVTITNNRTLEKISRDSSVAGSGIYHMDIPKGNDFSINVIAPGYMFYGQDIPLEELEISPEIRIDAPLEPIKVGSKVILNNIFFPTGDWNIQPESFPELRRLEDFLKLNTNVNVEISGHTDNTGIVEHKKELSARRAKSLRDHLLKANVSGYQLSVVGYGMEKPIADNGTEEGRQKNRRVEVLITAVK